MFPPLHAQYAARQAANLRECKGRFAELSQRVEEVAMIDFLDVSGITREDSNYWDPIHFTREIAEMLEMSIARVLVGGDSELFFATDFQVYGTTFQ